MSFRGLMHPVAYQQQPVLPQLQLPPPPIHVPAEGGGPTKRRKSNPRSCRSASEWRAFLKTAYASLLENQSSSLRSYCQATSQLSQYTRLSAVWKELKLAECLKWGLQPTDPTVTGRIHSKYPLDPSPSPTATIAGDPQPRPRLNAPTQQRNSSRSLANETRTNKQWKELLLDIYTYLLGTKSAGITGESVRSYCIKVLKSPNLYRRIREVWTELRLDNDLQNDLSPVDPSIVGKIETKYPTDIANESTRSRDLRPSSNSYFDAGEEALMVEIVAAFARAGFSLEKANLKDYADMFLAAEAADSEQTTITDGGQGVSMDTVERIYKHGSIKSKANVNPIDPKRASQADPQVLNAFYHQLEAWVKILHEHDPVTWPYATYANIPPTLKYNTDEQGPNPTALRNNVLIPRELIEQLDRLFQNTREGDGKMMFHYSVANIVRADGVQCHPNESVEGAPAPFVLISDASSANQLDTMEKAERDNILANQTENDEVALNEAVLEGWYDQFEIGKKDGLVNPFGFMIRSTPSGSMLKRTFYAFLLHFVQHLPHRQGPGGLGVILFLDWHCSRECPQSLIMSLIKFNILLMVLPSKTSIWGQPCDNGKNELTAKDIAYEAHNRGLLAGEPMDYLEANLVFRAGLERNCRNQNDELRRTGTNAVVSSFKKTGLHPIDYNNEGWRAAIQNFGVLNKMIRQERIDQGEIIPTITWISKARDMDEREQLSAEDVAAIKGFLGSDDFLQGAPDSNGVSSPVEIPLLFLAMAIADHLLGLWVLDEQRDIEAPPQPKHDYEIAALKLVEYTAVTPDIRVNTQCTLTPEQIALHKLETKLSLTPFGHAIILRTKEGG